MSKLILPKAFEAEPAKVIWKFRMYHVPEPQEVHIPSGSVFLHAELVTDEGSWVPNAWELWYEIREPEAVAIPHVYSVFATGELAIPKCAQHIWTEVWSGSQLDGKRVWHLYEYPSGTRIEAD